MYLKPGDRVTYTLGPKREEGIVKAVGSENALVVYHCAGFWENYQVYGAQSTPLKHLTLGWDIPKRKRIKLNF